MSQSKLRLFVLGLIAGAFALPASRRLQITEVMYNTAADESTWEWFELVNAGNSPVDLDGYVFDDFNISNNAKTEANIVSVASGGNSATTVLAAGGVGIVYNGSRLEYDEMRFRAPWRIDSSVPLIGVDGFEALNNSGDTFGIWESLDDYQLDLANTDDDEQLEVSTFSAAAAWLDFAAEGFPTAKNATIEWNGSGSYQVGSNWFANSEEVAGIVKSVETLLPPAPLNSENDVANPGIVVGGGAATDLVITELMYNPASSEPTEWEWIEVLNGTGVDIDFSTTPYYLDDLASGPLSEANVSVGRIPDGEVAVLFQDSIGQANIEEAWGEGINFIPVSSWSALNNGGDTVGIWSSREDYLLDSPEEGERTFDETVVTVSFEDGGEGWPNVSDGESISIADVEGDANDPANWTLSEVEDGESRGPAIVLSSKLVDHAGGDLGTPGSFGEVIVEPVEPVAPVFSVDVNGDGSVNAADAVRLCDAVAAAGVSLTDELSAAGILGGDADLNGRVEFSDFLLLSNNFANGDRHYGQGDFDCNGNVEFADFLTLSANFGSSSAISTATVPEPHSFFTIGFALLMLGKWRRQEQ